MLFNCDVGEDSWRVSCTARRVNQSTLKEISLEYSLEGLMLKLKFQYSGQLMQRTDSLEKDTDAGNNWRWEEKGKTEDEMVGWHHRPMDTSLSKLQELVKNREAWHATVHGVLKSWTRLSNSIERGGFYSYCGCLNHLFYILSIYYAFISQKALLTLKIKLICYIISMRSS